MGAVCLLDPDSQTATVITEREAARQLGRNEVLELPTWLPGFSVAVGRFFD